MDEAEWKEYAKSEGIMSQEVLEKMARLSFHNYFRSICY